MENKTWDFDSWAASYDSSVRDGNWIHENYDHALGLVADEVVERVKSRNQSMLDIGAGTGNLESLLVGLAGLDITAVEPSVKMREIFKRKLPGIKLLEGSIPDNLPCFDSKFDIITSTYVIHHVPFDELEKLIDKLCSFAADDSQIIIVDPMFETAQFREHHVAHLKDMGLTELADDIEDEYFHSVAELEAGFTKNGFEFNASRLTFYVWFVEAKKRQVFDKGN